jgi:hypothetical protein
VKVTSTESKKKKTFIRFPRSDIGPITLAHPQTHYARYEPHENYVKRMDKIDGITRCVLSEVAVMPEGNLETWKAAYPQWAPSVESFLAMFPGGEFGCVDILKCTKKDWMKHVTVLTSNDVAEEKMEAEYLYSKCEGAVFVFLGRCFGKSFPAYCDSFKGLAPQIERDGRSYAIWADVKRRLLEDDTTACLKLITDFHALRMSASTIEAFDEYERSFAQMVRKLDEVHDIKFPTKYVDTTFLGNMHAGMSMAIEMIILNKVVDHSARLIHFRRFLGTNYHTETKVSMEAAHHIASTKHAREVPRRVVDTSRSKSVSFKGAGKRKDQRGVDTESGGDALKVCFRWAKKGSCPFGDECKFSHVDAEKTSPSSLRRGRGGHVGKRRGRSEDADYVADEDCDDDWANFVDSETAEVCGVSDSSDSNIRRIVVDCGASISIVNSQMEKFFTPDPTARPTIIRGCFGAPRKADAVGTLVFGDFVCKRAALVRDGHVNLLATRSLNASGHWVTIRDNVCTLFRDEKLICRIPLQ